MSGFRGPALAHSGSPRLLALLDLSSQLSTLSDADALMEAVCRGLPLVVDFQELLLASCFGEERRFWYATAPSELTEARVEHGVPARHQALLEQTLRGEPPLDARASCHRLALDGRSWGALVLVGEHLHTEADARAVSHVAEGLAAALCRVGQASQLRAQADALDEQQRLLEAASTSSQAKDEFLTMLGHELRTPLAAIKLWGGLLRSGAAPDQPRALDAILDSAEAQGHLVDQLLDLSRLAAGKLVIEPQPVDVEALVSAAVASQQPSAQAKGVTLELVLAGPLPRPLLDPARFRQITLNLLSNAVKFTPRGGSATLRVERAGDVLSLTVTDTGEGISADFMPRLFERFSQAFGGETRARRGLGIGLSLTKQLVELHGGTIHVRSAGPGLGSTFVVRLPWFDAELSAEEEPAQLAPPGAAGERLEGVTVLLAEDDAHTLAALQWTLEEAGARVVAASSGGRALELFEQGLVADARWILVSDLGMPGMSGYELVQRLHEARRARGRGPMPACAVSAHARDADRQLALQAGFDMFLAKPITPQHLVIAIADLSHVDGDDPPPARPTAQRFTATKMT